MRSLAAICSVGLMVASVAPAGAEIVFLPGGQVASADEAYAFHHPSLRSVVFVSPETRQMAILPPAGPYVLMPPPLLWRAPTAMPMYPPVVVASGVNSAARPSNLDMNNYNLQRSHAFSQQLYYRDNYLSLGVGPVWYGYGYGTLGPAYPPSMAPGFNQPARPSNQSMNIYHLDRAHRFSMDAYKK
jgi:hypothetical protein